MYSLTGGRVKNTIGGTTAAPCAFKRVDLPYPLTGCGLPESHSSDAAKCQDQSEPHAASYELSPVFVFISIHLEFFNLIFRRQPINSKCLCPYNHVFSPAGNFRLTDFFFSSTASGRSQPENIPQREQKFPVGQEPVLSPSLVRATAETAASEPRSAILPADIKKPLLSMVYNINCLNGFKKSYHAPVKVEQKHISP